MLCYHLVHVLQCFKVRESSNITKVSPGSIKDCAELVDWVSAIHQEECGFFGTHVWEVVVGGSCHCCNLVPFKSCVHVLGYASFKVAVKTFNSSVGLWPIWW